MFLESGIFPSPFMRESPVWIPAPGGGGGPTDAVAWWKFEEGTGTSAADSSGNGNTGTLSGGATWATGAKGVGSSLDFPTNGSVVVADSASLDITSAFSLALWFKPANLTQTDKYILGKMNAAADDNVYAILWEYASNAVQFYSAGSPVGYPSSNTNISISDTDWHHIAYTYDGTTFRGYLDGVAVITPVTVSFSLTASTGALYLGNFGGIAQNITASEDDVRIFDRAITAAEVAAIYAE